MRIIPSVVCFIEDNGKFLFLERNHEPDLGKYVPPGGKIDNMEDPIITVKREVREETGLIVDNISYRGTTIHYGKNEQWIVFIFYTNTFSGDIVQGNEGRLFWIAQKDVYTLNLPPGDVYFLDYLFSGVPFFGTFWYNDKNELIDYKIWRVE